jgi:hypothetical protein
MSAGAIYILETDDGPMDRLLEGGMPSQAQLQNEFGTEHLTPGEPSVNSVFLVMLLWMIIVVIAIILGVDYVTRKNPIKHTRV